MRQLSTEETHFAAGGGVPIAVAVGVGVVGGAASAHLSGGNAGQVVAGAILGGVAGFWGAVGGVLQVVNAGVLGVIGTVVTNGQGQNTGQNAPPNSNGSTPGATSFGGGLGGSGGMLQIQDPSNLWSEPTRQFGF